MASILGIVPLQGLFSDYGWLPSAWFSMVVVVAPAALLRRRRPPGALDIWPGIVLLVPWLTLRYLGDTAVAGIVPTGQTWTALSQLLTELHETTRQEVAPIHTTVPVQLVICALAGLLAALVDLIAVVGRRGALAGVPLLVVFTVAGAVPRSPVSWPWFVIGAAGFLLLLTLDTADVQDRWGRRIGRAAAEKKRAIAGVGAPRIAVVAIVLAVAVPLVVPGEPRNLLANAFHGEGGVSGLSGGSGSSGQISPYASLRGQLDRGEPRKLADVQMLGDSKTDPYYLRSNVLSDYTGSGWRVSAHGSRDSVDGNDFAVDGGGSPNTASLQARITVDGLRGNPVSFNYPEQITGLPSETGWSAQDQLLLDSDVGEDTNYTITFRQPEPTQAQLQGASDYVDPDVRSELRTPDNVPAYARNLVRDIVAGKTTQYAKARAISDYFQNPDNGFVYDLQTKAGDSGSDLVDFLQNRRGYCQQYAGAMGLLLRQAGVPARVVLGYLNSGPDATGRFDVSTDDAHAWVEAWFDGVGWVPFDPTPSSGLPGGGSSLAWAPRDGEQQSPGASTSQAPSSGASSSGAASSGSSAAPSSSAAPVAPQADGGSASPAPWLITLAVVLVALVALVLPGALRASRRQRRYRLAAASASGAADVLWSELVDTATDLGFTWSDARSPRQVADWLAPHLPRTSDELRGLADAVERSRYAGSASTSGGTAVLARPSGDLVLVAAVRHVSAELRDGRSTRTRLRSRFWPASLGWTTPFSGATHR